MSYPLSHTRKQAHNHGILSPLQRKKKDCPISPQFLPTLTLITLFAENLKNSKKIKSSKEQNFLKGNRESIEIFWDVLFSTWNLQN